MKVYFLDKARSYFSQWWEEVKKRRYSLVLSLLFLVIANVLNYVFSIYTTRKAETAEVPDLILDLIPVFNVAWIYVYGFVIMIALLLLYPLFFDVKKLSFVISQLSLIIAIRSVFITLTHLKTPAVSLSANWPSVLSMFTFKNDMFFSGHTAIPFMGFLLFKGPIRYVFLAGSIILGTTVMLAHEHYTIDVLSAFFIAYGTFKLGEWIYNRLPAWRKKAKESLDQVK